jgi:protocatechuate 4,5-dioxygenase beta chain
LRNRFAQCIVAAAVLRAALEHKGEDAVAELVEIMGVTHAPAYARRLANTAGDDAEIEPLRAELASLRARLAAARPDLLIAVGNDHLNQLFMNNMPAFLIGKPPVVEGPWTWEQEMGIPKYRAGVDVDIAKKIIRGGSANGVDFAFSDEVTLDHAFTFPLAFLRPEADLPVIPIFTNVMAPPIPASKRFYEVGLALRTVIEELPDGLRVAVVCSGHLSVEIGGPRMRGGAPDREFDEWSMGLLGRGDVDTVVRDLTFERFQQAGNYTAGFLNFVMLLGIAGGRGADQSDCMHIGKSNAPVLRWSASNGAAT